MSFVVFVMGENIHLIILRTAAELTLLACIKIQIGSGYVDSIVMRANLFIYDLEIILSVGILMTISR